MSNILFYNDNKHSLISSISSIRCINDFRILNTNKKSCIIKPFSFVNVFFYNKLSYNFYIIIIFYLILMFIKQIDTQLINKVRLISESYETRLIRHQDTINSNNGGDYYSNYKIISKNNSNTKTNISKKQSFNIRILYDNGFDEKNSITGTGDKSLDDYYRNMCDLKTECSETCCKGEINEMECGKDYECEEFEKYKKKKLIKLIVFILFLMIAIDVVIIIIHYYCYMEKEKRRLKDSIITSFKILFFYIYYPFIYLYYCVFKDKKNKVFRTEGDVNNNANSSSLRLNENNANNTDNNLNNVNNAHANENNNPNRFSRHQQIPVNQDYINRNNNDNNISRRNNNDLDQNKSSFNSNIEKSIPPKAKELSNSDVTPTPLPGEVQADGINEEINNNTNNNNNQGILNNNKDDIKKSDIIPKNNYIMNSTGQVRIKLPTQSTNRNNNNNLNKRSTSGIGTYSDIRKETQINNQIYENSLSVRPFFLDQNNAVSNNKKNNTNKEENVIGEINPDLDESRNDDERSVVKEGEVYIKSPNTNKKSQYQSYYNDSNNNNNQSLDVIKNKSVYSNFEVKKKQLDISNNIIENNTDAKRFLYYTVKKENKKNDNDREEVSENAIEIENYSPVKKALQNQFDEINIQPMA